MRLAEAEQRLPHADLLAVAALALASVVAILLATGSGAVALAYGGGLAVLAAGGWALARRPSADPAAVSDGASHDWSVTAAAIDQPGTAIAITDRANRLVCANPLYESTFGSSHAPPRLALDGAAAEALTMAARTAWRDGEAGEVPIAGPGGGWTARVQRAGAAEDHLIWRFVAAAPPDRLAGIGADLTGALGPALAAAGIATAMVAPDGAILSASRAFAQRAAGDAGADLAGQDFVALLRADDRQRVHFAREGAEGSPQAVVPVPLGERPEDAPVLMLLLDGPTCLPEWGGEAPGQAVQIEALLGQLPLGLAMTDRDGRFLFANAAFLRAARVPDGQLPPFPSDLVVRQDKSAMVNAVRRFAQGAPTAGDVTVRLRGDAAESVVVGLAGVRGMGEAAVLLSLTDSSEETRLRRQVAQASKMQAVGQLAGGVAHDFNNVLTAIIGYCDLMLLRHLPGDSDYDDIQQIKANSTRAASLTRQLLAFSRQQTLQPQVLQLPDVIAEVSQLLKRLLGAKITLETHHDRDLGPVRADPRQLEQVIVNLAVNARDAIQARRGDQARGRLVFSTRRVTAEDIRRSGGSDIVPPGDYTALIAEDTGGGIPPQFQAKIFEPFFTTKDQGKGTGLGLSTVYGIVKQSGGFIFATNVEHGDGTRGARFTIYLPVYQGGEEDARRPEREAEQAGEWSGGGRILLVEDEDMVRAVAERSLARQGYTIVTAADGEEGLEAVRADPDGFDLIVSDVVMPTMDGPAMARAIRELAPRVPVLFMSGYAESQLRGEIDIEGMHFLPKPFSVAQIASKVGEVLRLERG